MNAIIIKRSIMFVSAALLVACASPAKNTSTFDSSGGKIKALDIVLAPLTFTPDAGGMEALKSEGWSDGSLERKFCAGVEERLKASGVAARCVRSEWGVHVPFAGSAAGGPSHILSIEPFKMLYVMETRYGAVSKAGFNPMLQTHSSLRSVSSGRQVWSADVNATFAPVDPTGARRFTDSLVEALRSSGAL